MENWPFGSLIHTSLSDLEKKGKRIFCIAATVSNSNKSTNISNLHSQVLEFMRLLTTIEFLGVKGSLGFGLKPSIQGIHGSIHTFIEHPSPTRKQAPFSITFFVFSMALQIKDAPLTGFLLNQSTLTLDLLHSIAMHKLSLLDATIHANFAIRALLKSLDFLKPNPSAPFGRHK